MKNFNMFVAIDWSGARSPVKTHAIALSWCFAGNAAPHIFDGRLSRCDVATWIGDCLLKNERCLIGIDCNLGYASAVGSKHFGPEYTYADLWQTVEDTSTGLPNYYAEGFWRHPDYGQPFWVSGPRPATYGGTIMRQTERACRDRGLGHPESPFKLIGPKQVGKGGLSGMRMMIDLKRQFSDQICIWPFENHADQARLVIAEIYPRLFLRMAGAGDQKIRYLDDLNRALNLLGSESMSPGLKMTDHISDAVLACAGLRHIAGSGQSVPQGIAQPKGMTPIIAKREGWIWGV